MTGLAIPFLLPTHGQPPLYRPYPGRARHDLERAHRLIRRTSPQKCRELPLSRAVQLCPPSLKTSLRMAGFGQHHQFDALNSGHDPWSLRALLPGEISART